jgi:tRNA1(Val) A37 N6-methylase TrmN6
MNLFSPVLSWGSYLPAFMHTNNYKNYVGVDVMKNVCDKVRKFGEWYINETNDANKNIEIICSPSEKLYNSKFDKKYTGYFDTCLWCPPYFDMEIYSEGEQSIKSYPNYEDWLEKYFETTVKLCKRILKKDGIIAIIVNNYFSLNKVLYPLVDDFNKICLKNFKLLEIIYLQNRTSPLRVNNKDRMERLYIYRK